jgi:hypothetical protein
MSAPYLRERFFALAIGCPASQQSLPPSVILLACSTRSFAAQKVAKPWLLAGRRGYGQAMASKTKDSRDSKDSSMATALGESALTGLPGRVGGAVAKPVSKHSRWSEQQIRTAIGLALLAWALYRVLRPTVRALHSR